MGELGDDLFIALFSPTRDFVGREVLVKPFDLLAPYCWAAVTKTGHWAKIPVYRIHYTMTPWRAHVPQTTA